MISRQELYDLVWSQPMLKAAVQFSVSGSYLARVCDYLNVPKPERGYWAKQAVGKAPKRPALPDLRPGDPISWQKGVDISPAFPEPAYREKAGANADQSSSPKVHHLPRGTKAHFENGRPIDEGDYIRPFKKLLVDITASKKSLDRAFVVANAVFNRLEKSGLRVIVAGSSDQLRRAEIDEHEIPAKHNGNRYPSLWSPVRPTVVYGEDIAVGLAIVEMSEEVVLRYVNGRYIRDVDYTPPVRSKYLVDHSWTTKKDVPSGRFRVIAYSPYWRVNWSENWQEAAKKTIESQLPEISSRIRASMPELVERVKEANRQAEIEHQKYLEEERLRREAEKRKRVEESKKESEDRLRRIIARWGEIKNIEAFLTGIEEILRSTTGEKSEIIRKRLELARSMLGKADPLDAFLDWKSPDEVYASKKSSYYYDDEE